MLALTSCMDAHPGMPYLTVSRHICLITTNRAKSRKIAKCHIFYTPNYPILPCLSASFTSDLTLHIDTRWKSAIYAYSKHNVHNVTHKSVKQKVSKSNKVSHHVYRTDFLVTAHLPMWCLAWCLDGLPWHVSHPMKGTSRTSRRVRHERVSRTHDCPRARKMWRILSQFYASKALHSPRHCYRDMLVLPLSLVHMFPYYEILFSFI